MLHMKMFHFILKMLVSILCCETFVQADNAIMRFKTGLSIWAKEQRIRVTLDQCIAGNDTAQGYVDMKTIYRNLKRDLHRQIDLKFYDCDIKPCDYKAIAQVVKEDIVDPIQEKLQSSYEKLELRVNESINNFDQQILNLANELDQTNLITNQKFDQQILKLTNDITMHDTSISGILTRLDQLESFKVKQDKFNEEMEFRLKKIQDAQTWGGNTFTCDFEAIGTTCLFSNAHGDQFDWKKLEDETTTEDTGPTSADGGLFYYYIEASTPRVRNDKAVLDTSQFVLDSSEYCLKFSYHMYGAPGTLAVKAGNRGDQLALVDELSGNQGNMWLILIVQIPLYKDPVIAIEGTVGNSDLGDIAVDNIILQKGSCSSLCGKFPCYMGECLDQSGAVTCVCNSGYTGPNCQWIDKSSDRIPSMKVTFEFDEETERVFTQRTDDKFDWTWMEDETWSSSTGPYEAQEGYIYMYTEASDPRVPGDYAVFDTSQHKLKAGEHCLAFYYHMYGSEMGTLSVSAGDRGDIQQILWTVTGDQGDIWKLQELHIPMSEDPVISIKGEIGSGSKSDMAIDNIVLKTGIC